MPDTQEKETIKREIEKKPVGNIGKIGNLTKEFELQYNEAGLAYARSGLAVNRPVKPGDWKGEKTTDFYDLVCFGSMAENVAEALLKGTRIVVVGRGEIEQWTDENGEIRIIRSIICDGIGPDHRWATAKVEKNEFRKVEQAQNLPELEEIPF